MAEGRKILGSKVEVSQLFLSLFQHMAEGVALHEVVLNDAGKAINYRILDVNPQYPHFTGLSRESVVGKLATEAYGTDVPPYLDEFCSVGLGASPRRLDTYFQPHDRHYEISIAPLGYGFFATIFMDVSKRKRQEQILRAKTDELEQFFRLSIDLLCMLKTDGRFLRVNTAWREALGWTAKDLEDKVFLDFIHPDDLSSTHAAFQVLSLGRKVTNFINRFRTSDGNYHFIEWHATPGSEGLVYAAARDVTEQRRNEEALRTSEERFHRIFKLIPNSLTIATVDGVLLDCNQAFCRISGYSQEDCIGRRIEDLGIWANYEQRKQMIQLIAEKGETQDFEVNLRSKDGHLKTMLLSGGMLDLEGQKVVVTLARDITEQRSLERQMLHTQKLESLGVMAGGIAHDFNNLLTGVLGNSDLALRGLSSASPLRENLDAISIAARRAAELCRQLLAYSGKGRFQVQPIHLEELVQEMGHLMAVSISKKAVLQFDFAKDTPGIQADATQLRQVIMNLIVNASESMGEAGGVISVRTGLTSVDAAYLKGCLCAEDVKPGDFVFIEVTDNGKGMDRETLRRIFDPFFSTKFTGRGLGLAAVLGIMRGHRGGIYVQSEPSRGSTFRLLFPALEVTVARQVTRALDHSNWKSHGHILVVDDEETVRNLSSRMLERVGFTVFTAVDGREAVNLYTLEKDRIRLVVLDLTMPNLDGEACFRLLQELNPDVKVVLSSGYNEQDVVNLFSGKGLAGFLQKPFSSNELFTKVREVLGE